MGPHSFKCGKTRNRENIGADRYASMGPHSFKCGKSRHSGRQCRNGAWLQWGRTLSSAESNRSFDRSVAYLRRFNGAALFQVRKEILMGVKIILTSQLQWGRTLSSAEREFKQPFQVEKDYASMGPHSFKCGKRKIAMDSPICSKKLQWGRTLSSAESIPSFPGCR